MLNLTDFVARLQQVAERNFYPSQNPAYLYEHATWNNISRYKQILQAALHERDAWAVTTRLAKNDLLKLGRVFCLEITRGGTIWGFEEECSMPPIDTWFALDEHSQDHEAILYCWIPKSLERLTEQEVMIDYFWRDKKRICFTMLCYWQWQS